MTERGTRLDQTVEFWLRKRLANFEREGVEDLIDPDSWGELAARVGAELELNTVDVFSNGALVGVRGLVTGCHELNKGSLEDQQELDEEAWWKGSDDAEIDGFLW